MKSALIVRVGTILTVSCAFSGAAAAYQRCERYEYVELKNMSAKQLETEFCKTQERVNEIQQFIGVAAVTPRASTNEAIRDRGDCWDALDKIKRQPQFKQAKATCTNLKTVDPLDAALEQSKRNLEQSQRRLENLKQ